MNTLLIVRPEILSAIVTIFLILYDVYCSRYREGKDYFFGFALMCLGHNIMALITEITVNMESIPRMVNDVCHVLFYLFSLLYSVKYFEYAISQIVPRHQMKKYMMIGYVCSITSIIVMLVSPIHYLQGNGTKYSAGTGTTLCYMLGFVLFIIADIIMVLNHKRINDSVVYLLLPLSFITLGLLLVQIIVPEFLFTSSALTLTAVGMFLAIENPVARFREKAYIDHNTQTWNRNGYEYDVEHVLKNKMKEECPISYVIADINGMKRINDSLGHLVGDQLVVSVAAILNEVMVNAFRIYRIGGDEFAILYLNKSVEIVKREIALASEKCQKLHFDDKIPVGVALGCAKRENGEEFLEMVHRADLDMYSEKEKFYREKGIHRR